MDLNNMNNVDNVENSGESPDRYYGQNNNTNGPHPPNEPPKKSKRGLKLFAALLCGIVFIAGIVIAIAFWEGDKGADKLPENNVSNTENGPSMIINDTPSSGGKSVPANGALSSVQIAEKVSDSVIAVLTYKNNTLYGEGSGIVMGVDASNKYTYIITCAHIVNISGISVRMQTSDGKQYETQVVGFDNRTDIAVLRVNKTGFKAAVFGDSTKLKKGEQVYVLGNPGGIAFYGSFTAGVVSAIDRSTSISESAYSLKCIQHDAAINPGNSGGALVNVYGQVVGINSSKIADTEYEGMGFAIPISDAKTIIENIIKSGYVPNRPKLGISYSAVSYNQSYSMVVQINGLPSGSIIIESIEPSSPLAKSDVKLGDIITAVNGKDMNTPNVLLDVIQSAKIGDTLSLSICRVNNDYSIKKFNVSVKLIEDKGSSEVKQDKPTNPFD
ncbi:MAG: S1C family serine protease [Oscillospiraceae bacterium]|jgi:serine protease Do|nr:S1C family serine protease [Oscillospiraceae bacterium]